MKVLDAEFKNGKPVIPEGWERITKGYQGILKGILYLSKPHSSWNDNCAGWYINDPTEYYIKKTPRIVNIEGVNITLTTEQNDQINEHVKYIIKAGEYYSGIIDGMLVIGIDTDDIDMKKHPNYKKATTEEIEMYKKRIS